MSDSVTTRQSAFKIGLRTIKTAVAVFFCLLIARFLPASSALISAIAAIVCMRETPEESLQMGINRFIGTLVGGLFGYLLTRIVPLVPNYDRIWSIVIIPVGMIFCTMACVLLNKKDAVIICCVVFLVIALDPALNNQKSLAYAIARIFDTTIGIIVATLVNRFFFPRSVRTKN